MGKFKSYSAIIFLAVFLITCITACNTESITNPEIKMLGKNWELFSSADVGVGGDVISSNAFVNEKAYSTNVPNTVLAALVDNEVYKDIHFSTNFDKIPREPFLVPWWYRKTINLAEINKIEVFRLIFEGINYRANVWLNSQLIASADTMEGSFRIFDFEVTGHLKSGENVLAVEVIPPKEQELTIGFVDWNPWPPDQNMGIWRPVKLVKSGLVSVKNIFVRPELDIETLKEATITISAELTNHSDKPTTGKVECSIKDVIVSQSYKLNPGEVKKVILSPRDHPELVFHNPRIWWPVNLGMPNLYEMDLKLTAGKMISDRHKTRFGIRQVSDYINENGHRGYIVNGKKILIRGGGWVDDVLLADTDKKIADQIQYVKHMGLNTIRLEGFWGRNKKIYECADENGILVMIGLSCQWEWEGYCGRAEDDKYMSIFSAEDIDIQSRSYMDQVLWLRNHPSVFLWVGGSDKLLVPEMEQRINDFIAKEDPTRPILGSCKYNVSDISGPSAVKMLGPYSYVTPNYWYVDTENGGAYGFNTETGPGIQPSPLESVKKMIPEESLWPINEIWQYHLGRNEFKKYDHWLPAFNNRYGEEDNVEDFTFKAQMSNYEAIRAMLEAFAVNKHNATGVIQWMLNSAMPGMLWQLYDWFLMPNGAFYGTMKACAPVNIVYNYGDENIYITNEFNKPVNDLKAEIRVFDSNSKEIFFTALETDIDENASKKIFDMPGLRNLSRAYFLDLKLFDSNNNAVQDNFYWLSTEKDVLDYENSRWFVTPNKSYADFTSLNNLEQTEINVSHEYIDHPTQPSITVTLENPSDKIAFFIELSVIDQSTGDLVLPAFWDDNYVSLLPGETKVIRGYCNKVDIKGEPEFRYKGWNVK